MHALYNRRSVHGRAHILSISLLLLAGCSSPKPAGVEDLRGGRDLSLFKLVSVRGARDGDRLAAQVYFSDSSSILTLDLRFAIGTPTSLESGTWRWARDNKVQNGTVTARSVTFLGGQDEGPSIGGRFDLAGADGSALYVVRLPVTRVKP